MSFSANVIEVFFQCLERDVFQIERKMRPSMHMKLRGDEGSVLPKGSAQQANGSKDLVGLFGPSLSPSIRRRRSNISPFRRCIVLAGANEALLRVDADATLHNTNGLGVFGSHPSEKLTSSNKNLKARLRRRSAPGEVHSKEITARVAVEPNGFGNRYSKSRKMPFSRWGNLTAIQASGEDEAPYNSQFSRPAPRHAMQLIAEACGTDDPAIKRGSTELGAHIELSPQVPDSYQTGNL